VLVTGGGGGLGRMMAEKLLSLGAAVEIWGRRGPVLEEAAGAMGADRVTWQVVDIKDPEAVERAVAAFRTELDRGYFGMVSTGPGHAEQVRELPVDAELVIMRLPISGG
jgi:NAD(P)-dependent dehydrogenase (short-subunit alcohol dehydrogenase family)